MKSNRYDSMRLPRVEKITALSGVNEVKAILDQVVQNEERLRRSDRDNTEQIKELTARNQIAVDELLSATLRAKNSERLRFRDVTVMCSLFVGFALFVILVSLGNF